METGRRRKEHGQKLKRHLAICFCPLCLALAQAAPGWQQHVPKAAQAESCQAPYLLSLLSALYLHFLSTQLISPNSSVSPAHRSFGTEKDRQRSMHEKESWQHFAPTAPCLAACVSAVNLEVLWEEGSSASSAVCAESSDHACQGRKERGARLKSEKILREGKLEKTKQISIYLVMSCSSVRLKPPRREEGW